MNLLEQRALVVINMQVFSAASRSMLSVQGTHAELGVQAAPGHLQ
jgi:hypothetical protein